LIHLDPYSCHHSDLSQVTLEESKKDENGRARKKTRRKRKTKQVSETSISERKTVSKHRRTKTTHLDNRKDRSVSSSRSKLKS